MIVFLSLNSLHGPISEKESALMESRRSFVVCKTRRWCAELDKTPGGGPRTLAFDIQSGCLYLHRLIIRPGGSRTAANSSIRPWRRLRASASAKSRAQDDRNACLDPSPDTDTYNDHARPFQTTLALLHYFHLEKHSSIKMSSKIRKSNPIFQVPLNFNLKNNMSSQ